MKPTLSYVRGLREVLKIPTSEERRTYIKDNSKNKLISRINLYTGFVLTNITAPMSFFLIEPKNLLVSGISGLSGLALLTRSAHQIVKNIDNKEYLETIGRAQQTHISKKRNPNDFPESKLALDDFPSLDYFYK